eukprot:gene41414-51282_t
MDHKNLIAIDIHTHAEVSCRNPFDNYGEEYDRAADKFFGSDRRPTIAETVTYYREKKIGLVMFTVDSESQLGRRRIPNEGIAQAARETVLATSRSLGKNLVVLAGDTHNAWANELQDMNGKAVGVEFATSSVTSPGFEEYLPNEKPATLAGALEQLIGPLQYCDTSRRGYMVVTATATECRADWVYVSTITSRSYTASTDKSLKVVAGAAGVGRIVAA